MTEEINSNEPAPDELDSELRRVRSAKNQHVKANNWELAALYREIEKVLEREPHCDNCKHMLSAIGVGQGLICDLNKCRIPHSQHKCDHHEYKNEVTKPAPDASLDSQAKSMTLYDGLTMGFANAEVTDERIYEESTKKGYSQLATQLAWEDGAKWCRAELKK